LISFTVFSGSVTCPFFLIFKITFVPILFETQSNEDAHGGNVARRFKNARL
jgi:hypothetical protein